jgi:uncharacterized protein (TIGR02466 family)
MKIESLFPTPVYKDKVMHSLSEEEQTVIKNGNYSLGTSGTHSDFEYRYLDNPVFKNLKNELQKHVNEYAKTIFKYNLDVYITQSWININPPGSHHSMHTHSNSVFSGVYYITVPAGANTISFHSPIKNMFFIEPEEWNSFNSPVWSIGVEEGQVILFPSSLYHEVTLNVTNQTRICIAFNTFLRGEIGEKTANRSNYQVII